VCAFLQDNDNYYVNPWLRTCAFSASRIYIFTPLKRNTKTRLVLFSLSLFGGSVACFMRLWLVFCFGGGFSAGYMFSGVEEAEGRRSRGSMVTLLFKMCARALTGNGRKRGASSISLSAAPLPFSHLGSSASFTGFFVFPLLFFFSTLYCSPALCAANQRGKKTRS